VIDETVSEIDSDIAKRTINLAEICKTRALECQTPTQKEYPEKLPTDLVALAEKGTFPAR